MIRIGCSGWNYASWRASGFYADGTPPRRWLQQYAACFDTVEVNATFYRLASRAAVERWRDETPPGFCFAIKASRYLTHVRRLADMERGLERLVSPLEPLAAAGRLGPLLWQLPATFRRDDDRLAFALERLPAGRHAFEFRDGSWLCTPVYDMLRARDVALVVADRAGTEAAPAIRTAGFTYVRFHHGRCGRRGNYSRAELDRWAQRLSGWADEGDVYAYFNNDWEGFAPRNARTLADALELG